MKVPASGNNKKFVIFGGVDYKTGEIIFRQEERKNSESFTKWLDRLLKTIPYGKIVVVLDNARYHHSKVCQRWWRRHKQRISSFFLPAYSPELNLMERIWLYLKSKISCHRWKADLAALKMVTFDLLLNLDINFLNQNGIKIGLNQNICTSA